MVKPQSNLTLYGHLQLSNCQRGRGTVIKMRRWREWILEWGWLCDSITLNRGVVLIMQLAMASLDRLNGCFVVWCCLLSGKCCSLSEDLWRPLPASFWPVVSCHCQALKTGPQTYNLSPEHPLRYFAVSVIVNKSSHLRDWPQL